MYLTQLEAGVDFPPTRSALEEPNGLLAIGGQLTVQRLLTAYSRGIFPWYEAPQPILWWSPNPRSVLFPHELHISRSLGKTLRRNRFTLSVDKHFTQVMRGCAQPRRGACSTWIDEDMIAAYRQLHALGFAHSIEVSNPGGTLIGGLYGVSLGRVFFGESMFSQATDASKVALVGLVDILCRGRYHMIDCQVEHPHLKSLGARSIDRLDFERRLAQTVAVESGGDIWDLPVKCGDLL
ncbi:MAG: leucyl/phenylalanyl-tRNA--protein transferase [Halioglobus sp.]|nr:leucyl/phenylalanyl-tRNA--protein transferase [Halioglobus sp.]